MTLTYWVAFPRDESIAFSLRRRTRREITEALATGDYPGYTRPGKITITYRHAFDLALQLLGPGGCSEEGNLRDSLVLEAEEE